MFADTAYRAARIRRRHELPQFVTDAPCAFVSHASLSLDLLGRHAVPSAGQEIHRKEPYGEFGAALVKDGPGAGVDVMAAPLAGVSPALAHWMKLHPFVANRAMRFVAAVLNFHDALEASGVIGILSLKLL